MAPRLLILVPLLLSGCVSTIGSVVTAPFKVAGKAADWATTSQDEADRNRGRKLRHAEAQARRDCQARGSDRLDVERCVRERLAQQGLL